MINLLTSFNPTSTLQRYSDTTLSLSKTKMWVFQSQSFIDSDLAQCVQENGSERLARAVGFIIASPNSIQSTAIKASDLPKYHWTDPTCYAAISIDGVSVKNTGCEKGINPEWNSSFDLYVLSVCCTILCTFIRCLVWMPCVVMYNRHRPSRLAYIGVQLALLSPYNDNHVTYLDYLFYNKHWINKVIWLNGLACREFGI